jgi:hypothetical protein
LSIDIDGPDLLVWRGVKDYCPKVVLIEVLGQLGPCVEHVYSTWPGGSSFRSTLDVGREKGYTLVCHTLDNMCFVRDDLVSRLDLPPEDLANPTSLFNRDSMETDRLRLLWRRLRWMSWQRIGLKLTRIRRGLPTRAS